MLWQLLLMILGWLVVLRWKNRKFRMVAQQMKSDLSELPVLGHVHHFIGDGEVRMSVLQSFGREAIKNKGWSSVQLGSSLYGYVAEAEDADYVLKTHLEKDDVLNLLRLLTGNGVIFAPVSIWRFRRKILAPTFKQSNLNGFVEIFYQQSLILAHNLRQHAGRDAFSFWNYITSFTMDSIGQTTLGVDIGAQKEGDHTFFKYFRCFSDLTAKRIFQPWLHNETCFKYLGYFGMYPLIMGSVDYIHDFIRKIIVKKREDFKKYPNGKLESSNEKFRPILELLIEASGGEKGYTNQELLEEALVLLGAGTETSAAGDACTLTMLAKYPDIQEKVYEELCDMIGDSEAPITAQDLSKLTYLEAVIKETLRLYPPVPITARKILKDDVTPSGIKLISGMGVVICVWAVHRNPKYWGHDADDFRPERFFDSPPSHPAAFMPFSTGPRSCLGYKYSMMSMMTTVAVLLRRYRILPLDHEAVNKLPRLSYEVSLKSADNFPLKLELRR